MMRRMQRLTWTDAVLHRAESRSTPLQLNLVIVYDPATSPHGEVAFADVRAAVAARLPLAPVLRHRIATGRGGLGATRWLPDERFDLDYHVRHVALPAPGSWVQVQQQIARLQSRPLDLTRPPWELTVIDGLGAVPGVAPNAFAVSLKVHLAGLPRLSPAPLLSALHDLDAAASTPGRPDPGASTRPRTGEPRAGLTRPLRLTRTVARAGPQLTAASLRRAGRGELTAPASRFQRPVAPPRTVDGSGIELATLLAVRATRPGASATDVVLTVVGGALRRYLEHHDELPAASLIAGCPASEPAETEAPVLVRRSLHTDLADPAERLAAVAADGVAGAAAEGTALRDLAALVPAPLAGVAARTAGRWPQLGPALVNTLVWVLPGSPVPLYFAGAAASQLYAYGPPVGGAGLTHAATSYGDRLTLTAAACARQLPDPEVYARYLADAVAELAALVAG